jgi:hypothetical protein
MSEEVSGSERGASVRAKANQFGQNTAKVSESWIVNAASAPTSIGQAALYAAKSTWNTRGAWAFGVLVVMCGIGPALSIVGEVFMGAVTAGSDRVPQETTLATRLGRGTVRTGGAVVRVVATSASEGVAAIQADDREPVRRAPSRLRRVNNNRRLPDAYRGR